MPSIRLTVALNSNQSTKTPLLIPSDTPLDPSAPKSCYSLVLTAAKSKLRLKSKKPARVFVQGTGEELLDEERWKVALQNDIVLLVSGGEEYIGLRKEATEQSLDSLKGMCRKISKAVKEYPQSIWSLYRSQIPNVSLGNQVMLIQLFT